MGTPKRPVSAFSSSISAPLSLAGTNASLPGKIQRTHQSAVEGWSGSSVAISLYIENYSHKIQYCHSTIVTSLWPRSSGSSIFKGWSFRAIWNFSIDFNKFGSPNEYRPRMDGWRERPYLSIKKKYMYVIQLFWNILVSPFHYPCSNMWTCPHRIGIGTTVWV